MLVVVVVLVVLEVVVVVVVVLVVLVVVVVVIPEVQGWEVLPSPPNIGSWPDDPIGQQPGHQGPQGPPSPTQAPPVSDHHQVQGGP